MIEMSGTLFALGNAFPRPLHESIKRHGVCMESFGTAFASLLNLLSL